MTPSLAKQIKIARITLEWSREELAHKAGVCKSTIDNIESGRNPPLRRTILRLTFVLRQAGIEMPDPNAAYEELRQRKSLDNSSPLINSINAEYQQLW